MNGPTSIKPEAASDLISSLHSRALRLYPRSIRRAYGAEMNAVFDQALCDARKRGTAAVVGVVAREFIDFPACLIREHIATRQSHSPIHGGTLMTASVSDRCSRCGMEMAAEHRFCPVCGAARLPRRDRFAAWLDQRLAAPRPWVIALLVFGLLLPLSWQASHLVTRVGLFARWSYPLAAVALAAGSAAVGFAVMAPGRRPRRAARALVAVALTAAALGAIQLGDNLWLKSRSGTEHHQVFVLPGMRLESAAVDDLASARAMIDRFAGPVASSHGKSPAPDMEAGGEDTAAPIGKGNADVVAGEGRRSAGAEVALTSFGEVRRLKTITLSIQDPHMVVGVLVSSAPDAGYLIALLAFAVVCAVAGLRLGDRRAAAAASAA